MVRAGGFQDVVEGYHLSVLLFLLPVSDCDMREVDDLRLNLCYFEQWIIKSYGACRA